MAAKPAVAEDDSFLAKPSIVDLVLDRWKRCDDLLYSERRNYWLNFSFYHGEQWLWWDTTRRQVNSLPVVTSDSERVRITINKLKPRWEGLAGRMLARNLSFEAEASAADDATVQGAQLAEWVLESMRVEDDWEAVRGENFFNTLAGGTSAIVIERRDGKGRIWRNAQNGDIDSTGDLHLQPLSIVEFSVQGGTRRWQDATWFAYATAEPPEQIRDRYDLDWTPTADAASVFSPLQRRVMAERGIRSHAELCATYVMYEIPTKRNPQGRHAVICNGRAVLNQPWPFTFDELNIQVFRAGVPIPGRWTGDTFVNDARKVQTLYNMVRSAIAEHIKLAGNVRMLVPNGSLTDDSDLTDDPGELVNYDAEAGAPSYMAPAELGRVVQLEPAALEAELDDIMHTHATSRGEAPGDRNSGLALSILAEKDDTPLGLMARDQANGWARLGHLILEELSERVDDKREATIRIGKSTPLHMEWDGSMLKGQTNVYVPLEATMPHSRNARQAMLTAKAQAFPQWAAGLTPAQVEKLYAEPGERSQEQIIDSDVDCAENENWWMSVGQVEFPEKWHDHAKHIAEHNAFRNSQEYRKADRSIRELFEAHIVAHQRLVEEEALAQAKLNAIHPGIAAMPQANEPIGSAVPAPLAEQQAMGAPQ